MAPEETLLLAAGIAVALIAVILLEVKALGEAAKERQRRIL